MTTGIRKKNLCEDNSLSVPVPEGALILGEGRYYSRDCYKTQLNNNVLVVGTSGCGKTRSVVMPNLLQASGSYVVSDPKGNLYKKLGPYLKSKGYEVVTMDFIHPGTSNRYNPLGYCRNTSDIQKLANVMVYQAGRSVQDPFWDQSSFMLLLAIIGYIIESDEFPESEKNFTTLRRLIAEASRDEEISILEEAKNDPFLLGPTRPSHMRKSSSRSFSPLELKMISYKNRMAALGKESWAVEKFDEYNTSPDKTHQCINMTALCKLVTFGSKEIRRMLSGNDIQFAEIGQKPTALFVMVSDTDRSMDLLVNLFYTQLMNELCTYADDHCKNSCLPVPVQFILDDFATNARIDNFENMIANIRSRGISAMLMVQSEAQLSAGYGDNAQTIIDNCNTYVYMGGSDPDQAKRVALRANKMTNTILNMPLSYSWIFRRGEKPVFCHNFDLVRFEEEKGLYAEEETEEKECELK
ncbi:MAG: type IV secretory system conjugative DNA transfer family protein [Lachnospiraceae bacterium]|nr:type IV secretory system conjugative DNA transfer family protein [Lachnospiraceae bacterium]